MWDGPADSVVTDVEPEVQSRRDSVVWWSTGALSDCGMADWRRWNKPSWLELPAWNIKKNLWTMLYYRSFTKHSNDFETWPGKRLRPYGLSVKALYQQNLIIKSLQKIRFQNIKNRRPHGFSIKHGSFWDFLCAEPLRLTRVQTFLLELDESWVTLSDQCRKSPFRGPKSINQCTEYSNYFKTQY